MLHPNNNSLLTHSPIPLTRILARDIKYLLILAGILFLTVSSVYAADTINAVTQEAPSLAGVPSWTGPAGYNGIPWGQGPGESTFLKYVFTDPATGENIYIDADDASESGRDWKECTQYHFWNDQFFKLSRYLPNKQAWENVKNAYAGQLGLGRQDENNPNIWLWETQDVMAAINFDDAFNEGSLILASKGIADKINVNESSAFKSLVAALDDTDARVRARAAMNLGVMKDPQATLALIPLLRDQDFIVRYNTAYALGEIKDERAVQSLIEALRDEDNFVSSFAAEALGKIGSPSAVKPLIESVAGNKAALTALEEITGKNFGKDQMKWDSWWQENRKTSL